LEKYLAFAPNDSSRINRFDSGSQKQFDSLGNKTNDFQIEFVPLCKDLRNGSKLSCLFIFFLNTFCGAKFLFKSTQKYDICQVLISTVMKEKIEVPKCQQCAARPKSVFCTLNSEQLLKLDQEKGCGFYSKGEIIFKEGSFSKGLFCVNKGKIKLSRLGQSGKEQIVRFATSGDVMGYNSMLSKRALGASAIALEDCTICFVPASHFFDIIRQEP
jgi:hypothetical protein